MVNILNKKIKLLTLVSTLTTVGLEPISDLANAQTMKDGSNDSKLNTFENFLKSSSGGSYFNVEGENQITNTNTSPFVGYVPTTFDGEASFDNGSFTSIKNYNYLVVPFWVASTKRPHFDSFASYAIDSITKQVTAINSKVNLGYDVENKIILPPQLVGEDLVTFFRDVDSKNPYGKGEWTVGVTNIKTGDYTSYLLTNAIGNSTANFRNIYVMVDDPDSLTPNYYLATYEYTTEGKITVLKLSNFNPRTKTYETSTHNSYIVNYSNTYDVMFGNGFAVPKHSYDVDAGQGQPLFGWNNLLQADGVKPIIVDYTPYTKSRGYWLFQTDKGLMFANLGNDLGGKANLQLGIIDSNNKAKPTANFSFATTDGNFDFYQGTAITFSFFKGDDDIYYLVPSGVKSDTPDISSLPVSSQYFAFNIENPNITNLNSYNYNDANGLFKDSQNFSSSRINYITSTGSDILTSDIRLASSTITQRHFRTQANSLIDKLTSFLSQNLYFVDLTDVYNNSATNSQKLAVEKMAQWLGKSGNYTFSPMTIDEIKTALIANFSTAITDPELTQIMNDFIDVQSLQIQNSLKNAYNNWTVTIEEKTDGTGHQWGWYNPQNLFLMFPAYIIDADNGLIFDNTDTNLKNPRIGLQRLITEFQKKLAAGTPISFTNFLDQYINPTPGGIIEQVLIDFKSFNKNQLDWFRQKINSEFNTFYYGFSDLNQTNDIIWNYFLQDTSHELFGSIDQMVEKWKVVMNDAAFNGKSVVNFFVNSKIWANLSIDKLVGKDAAVEQFAFEYTDEFLDFKNININSFNAVIDDLYDNFLQKEYLGYGDQSSSEKLDVSMYFSGDPILIMKKSDFIVSFPHNAGTVYTHFSKFYSWTPGSGRHDIQRTAQFNDWVTSQKTSLIADFVEFIHLIENNYYGYASLAGNNITKYMLPTLAVDSSLDSNVLADAYFQADQPIELNLLLGRYGTKSLIEKFKDPQNPDTKAWIDDQKNQLKPFIQNIIDSVKDSYYGWILPSDDSSASKIDYLLGYYPLGVELDADAIIATFKIDQLPKDLSGLFGLKSYVNDIGQKDIDLFNSQQVKQIQLGLEKIVNKIEKGYFGYLPQGDAVKTGAIVQVILYGHKPGTKIDITEVSSYFKNGFEEGKAGYPKKVQIGGFLTQLLNSSDLDDFVNDQYNQLLADFNQAINKLKLNYYGFDMSNEDDLNSNFLIRYGIYHELNDWSANVVIDNFLKNFPTDIPTLEGIWNVAPYLKDAINDEKIFTSISDFQEKKLMEIWNSDEFFSKIQQYWYGYSINDIKLPNSNLSVLLLTGLPSGSALESSSSFERFKKNMAELGGNNGIIPMFRIAEILDNYLNLTTEVQMFIDNQNNAGIDNIAQIMQEIIKYNWRVMDNIGKEYIELWFNFPEDYSSNWEAVLNPKLIEDAWSNTVDASNSLFKGDNIYNKLNTGKFKEDLKQYIDGGISQVRSRIENIFSYLIKYYWGFNFTQNWDISKPNDEDTDVFEGARYIFAFFKTDFNSFGGTTLELPTSIDEMLATWLQNIQGSTWNDSAYDGKESPNYTSVMSKLYSMLDGGGFVENFINYQKEKFGEVFRSIAENYINNYYGYATGDDLLILKNWFGTQEKFLTIDEILVVAMSYIQTLDVKLISTAIGDLSTILGTGQDSEIGGTILGRDFKAAMDDINAISRVWRNNYYGLTGYTGNWFKETFNEQENNWKDITTHAGLASLRTAALEKSQFIKNFAADFGIGDQNLLDFRAYQESEMSKLLQPIVDFYNQWYMGYNTTETYLLEKTDPSLSTGWNYADVFAKISNSIIKDSETKNWEAQYIRSIYDGNVKQNSFRSEQMNSLITSINDDFINNFLKNNYFGYNFGAGIPSNVQTILDWQNSTEINAIWDTTYWGSDAWASTTASTYKIFNSIDANHHSNLQQGKSFKDVFNDYITKKIGTISAEFSNFQLQALSIELTSLISRYQTAYFGYTSAEVINSNYLPGLVPTSNGNYNWSIEDAIKILISDPGNYQDANRHTNGKWLHNTAVDSITKKIDQEPDNFVAKEKAAYDAEIARIISDYTKIFRGFMNDVNGNKLSYKTLGGDDAIANGVFVSKAIDVTTEIFNKQAFENYLHGMRNTSITNTKWEANILSGYDNDRDNFKAEQEQILRNSLESIHAKYSAVSKGYFATFNGTPLQYPNLPGWTMGPTGTQIDFNLTIGILDQETYNNMETPNASKALYRLSSEIYKKYDDNVQNFANEQIELINQDLASNEIPFIRQTEIFDFLNETESNKNWKTQPTYRGDYSHLNASKEALVQFLNKAGNPVSIADLNSITSNWYSLTEGPDSTDWNNPNARHTFLFFAQYGMPLQIVYEPGESLGKMRVSLIELNSGQHLINGEIDSIEFLPTSQEGNQIYGPTLIIKRGNQEFNYRIISSNNRNPFDELLFTIADISTGTPVYDLAQKITIAKNLDTPTTIESSLANITYDKTTFSLSNFSPNYDGTFDLQAQSESGGNKIESLATLHQTTKAVRDIYIQMGIGSDLESERKLRSNIAIMSPDNRNRVLSIDDVISRLPSPTPPIETGSGPLNWIMPLIIVVGVLTVVGPLAYLIIRKLRLRTATNKTVKRFSTENIKVKNPKRITKSKVKGITKSLFKNKK